MKGVKSSTKKKCVPVYFEHGEFLKIRKKAGKELLSVSPYLRKIVAQALDLDMENS